MKTIRLLLAFVVIGLVAAPRPALAQKKNQSVLRFYCWSEYVPQSVVDGFSKETGVKVFVENYDSNEVMLAKLLAGGSKYDLIQPSEYAIEGLIKTDKLEALNLENIPNISNLDPKFTKMPHDPEGKYSVPWMAGTVGIVVNTTKITDPVKGFKDVFSGKYKRRIVVLRDSREIVSWALATLGNSVNDITPESLEKVKPLLKQWLPQVKVYDSDSPKTALLNGDVDLGIIWSGEAAKMLADPKKGKKFVYLLPAEGAHLYVDSLAIPKGAANKENAEKFINYILRPDVSVKISKEYPYTNPNAEARKLLTPAQLENAASYPPEMSKMETFRDIGAMSKDVDKVVMDSKGEIGGMLATTGVPGVTGHQRRPGLLGWLLMTPMVLWLVAFVVVPTGILFVYSFCQRDDFGQAVYSFTWENYRRIFIDSDTGKFGTTYLTVFLRSILYAGLTTIICLVVGYPVAWFIGRAPENRRNLLLTLVMIPFWTSFLIRTYAWIMILSTNGLLNSFLEYTKLISEPFEMLYTSGAVVLGLIYSYLPFLILPIYGSVEKLDNALVEAAFDLGAGPIRTFQTVILPLTRPGIVAGVLLVFIPAIGMFAITQLMGGGTQPTIGEVIQDQFTVAPDWPFGAALGMTIVFLFAAAFWLTSRQKVASE